MEMISYCCCSYLQPRLRWGRIQHTSVRASKSFRLLAKLNQQNPIISLPRVPSVLKFRSADAFPAILTSRKSFVARTSRNKITYDRKGARWQPAENEGEDVEVLVQNMLFAPSEPDLVEEVEKKLAEGADFGDLATEQSLCQSRIRGGMLGWIRKGRCTHIPEFEEAIFKSPLNKVVRCETNIGLHLVQVLDKRRGILQGIDPDDLYPLMQDDKFIKSVQLIDVREPYELDIAALPGFKNYPYSKAQEWIFSESTDLDPYKDTYVLCHVGKQAGQIAELLKAWGCLKVYYVIGGIHEYARVAYSRDENLVLKPYQYY